MNIKNRIQNLIDIKSAGNKAKFAEMLDYSPQHLQNILKGNIGLTVVERILTTFKDVDGRWLILGEGDSPTIVAPEIRRQLYDRVNRLLELDKYIPYMSPVELESYRAAISMGSDIQVNRKQIYDWEKAMEKSKGNAKR